MEEEIAVPEFTKHEPGTFSWVDLSTSDLDAAIALYTDIFGWEVDKQDIPGGVYAIFRVNGKDVAAASPQRPDEQGVPPHWNVYITVDDAEQTAKQAEALGGTIVAPAFDVMEFGRMAVIADPTGAVFSVTLSIATALSLSVVFKSRRSKVGAMTLNAVVNVSVNRDHSTPLLLAPIEPLRLNTPVASRSKSEMESPNTPPGISSSPTLFPR